MSDAQGDTWATSGYGGHSGPQVFVQWKGTEVCLDFHCECGYFGHYDGGFAYGLKCGQCGKMYTVPHSFGLIPGGIDGAAMQDTDRDHWVDGVRRSHPERVAEVAVVADEDEEVT